MGVGGKVSCTEALRSSFIGNFVAEIIFFLFKVSEAMLEPSIRLYIYKSVCIENYHSEELCAQLGDHPIIEDKVQHQATHYIMMYKMLINIPVIFLGLFCGAWSDKVGRKIPVLLPCVGTIIAILFYMASNYPGLPMLPFLLAGAATRGLFGKSAILTMALHSYIADLTCKSERTQRLGRLLGMNFFGFFTGSLLSGTALEMTSYEMVFLVVAVVNLICIMVAIVFMREDSHLSTSTADTKMDKQNSGCFSLFQIDNIISSLSVLTTKRGARGRCYLTVLFLSIFINQACKSGEIDITLLFVKKSPLAWTESMYGYLLATDYVCLGVATMFILPVASKVFHLHDLTLVCLGVFCRSCKLFLLAFSTQNWMVFLTSAIGCPSALALAGTRSFISKMMSPDEVGKAFSLMSILETVSNFVGSVTFALIYGATFRIYSGMAFLISGGVFALWFLVILSMSCFAKKDDRRLAIIVEDMNVKQNYGATDGVSAAPGDESEASTNDQPVKSTNQAVCTDHVVSSVSEARQISKTLGPESVLDAGSSLSRDQTMDLYALSWPDSVGRGHVRQMNNDEEPDESSPLLSQRRRRLSKELRNVV